MNSNSERRFLIDIPLSWMAKFKTLTSESFKIYQTYLVQPEKTRVRASFTPTTPIKYELTRRLFASDGSPNGEMTHEISQEVYIQKLRNTDFYKAKIDKFRYELKFQHRLFELDVFGGHLNGLAILKVDHKDGDLVIPPYLEAVKEITRDEKYRNYNLANLTSCSEIAFFVQ